MRVPVEVSEETLFQLNELNTKEGCPGRSDLELLAELIRNIVDLTHETFIVNVAEKSEIEADKIGRSDNNQIRLC